MKTPTISSGDGGRGAAERGSPEHAPNPAQEQSRAHAARAPVIQPSDTPPPGGPRLLDASPPDLNVESTMSDDEDVHRATTHVRTTIDDFLAHLRYVARQDWNEFRHEELLLAQNRYDWFTEELWKLIMEGKHRADCDCEVCTRLRVEEDR